MSKKFAAAAHGNYSLDILRRAGTLDTAEDDRPAGRGNASKLQAWSVLPGNSKWMDKMKIQLRAASLLGLDEHQHVSLKGLADDMDITRFQLMHFLDNASPQISRRTLEAVCKYLVEHRRVEMDNMFQQLFVVEPESIWPLLAARQRINFSVGVRKTKHGGFEQFVVAADAVLQSVMVNQLMGSTAVPARGQAGEQRDPRQVIDSQLVLSWGAPGVSDAAVQRQANAYFTRCVRGQTQRGDRVRRSIKSNPACDHAVARGFRRARAFHSQDNVRRVDDRSCPFVMMYRSDDPHPPSCWAGTRLAKDDVRVDAGIYYTCRPGVWELCPVR